MDEDERPAAARFETVENVIRYRALSACKIFSAVIGSDLIRTPTASSTALAIAAAVGINAVSPMLML
jgi:hypothetical protein